MAICVGVEYDNVCRVFKYFSCFYRPFAFGTTSCICNMLMDLRRVHPLIHNMVKPLLLNTAVAWLALLLHIKRCRLRVWLS